MGNSLRGSRSTTLSQRNPSSPTRDGSKQSVRLPFTQPTPKKKLAPAAQNPNAEHECPICFLNFDDLNTTVCCTQTICTECYLLVCKTSPSPCPFCSKDGLDVIFDVEASEKSKQKMMMTPNAVSTHSSTPSTGPDSSAKNKTPVFVPLASVSDRQSIEREIQQQRSRSRADEYYERIHRSSSSSSRRLRGASGRERRTADPSENLGPELHAEGSRGELHDVDIITQLMGDRRLARQQLMEAQRIEEMMLLEAIRLSMAETPQQQQDNDGRDRELQPPATASRSVSEPSSTRSFHHHTQDPRSHRSRERLVRDFDDYDNNSDGRASRSGGSSERADSVRGGREPSSRGGRPEAYSSSSNAREDYRSILAPPISAATSDPGGVDGREDEDEEEDEEELEVDDEEAQLQLAIAMSLVASSTDGAEVDHRPHPPVFEDSHRGRSMASSAAPAHTHGSSNPSTAAAAARSKSNSPISLLEKIELALSTPPGSSAAAFSFLNSDSTDSTPHAENLKPAAAAPGADGLVGFSPLEFAAGGDNERAAGGKEPLSSPDPRDRNQDDVLSDEEVTISFSASHGIEPVLGATKSSLSLEARAVPGSVAACNDPWDPSADYLKVGGLGPLEGQSEGQGYREDEKGEGEDTAVCAGADGGSLVAEAAGIHVDSSDREGADVAAAFVAAAAATVVGDAHTAIADGAEAVSDDHSNTAAAETSTADEPAEPL